MENLKQLLEYIQVTNPDMTMDKLIEELQGNLYSSKSLIFTFENFQGNGF